MSWKKVELLFVVRDSYFAGRTPRETVDRLRRHLEGRDTPNASPAKLHLTVVETASR